MDCDGTVSHGASTLRLDVEQHFASRFIVAPKLDVTLPAGGFLVLFGPSGGGKTTILRQIAGLERPDRALVRWAGETWCDSAAGIWRTPQERRVGVVSQQPALFPHLSVRDNIEYGLGAWTPDRRHRRSDELLELLDIADLAVRLPPALSGGQAQRVAVARALAPQPQLMLLDEPFAALDAPARMRLRRDVRTLLRRIGTPAVLVTHDRGEALAMGDLMAVVIGGRVRQTAQISEVFSRPIDVEVAASLGVEAVLPARVVDSAQGLVGVAIGPVLLQVADRDGIAVGSDVYACIRAEDVTLQVQSAVHASTRNHLAGRVVSISPEGAVDRVSLDCGFPLDALVTHRASEELKLEAGMSITAAIKATSVHLVAR
jgi:molybdate transport system ATP-binding protein